MTCQEPIEALARSLIDDARKDREVLRRRWLGPPWRGEIQRIAEVLEQHPLLIVIVQQQIESELARMAAGGEPSGSAATQ